MFSKPTLIVDEAKCRQNIERMALKAKASSVVFRPHFKTHQDYKIGSWFRDYGVSAITVSSVSMALFFAEAGWNDITIAFPVNYLEIDEINKLAKKISLNIIITNKDSIDVLKKRMTNPVGVFIETDCGYHRTGINAENENEFFHIIDNLLSDKILIFKGLLAHFGNTYQCTGEKEVKDIYYTSFEKLLQLKKSIQKKSGKNIFISVGDTPSCSFVDDLSEADEIRPGNFLFYDVQQLAIGSCTSEQIAIAVICPVVAVFKERFEVIIYGGATHLSKDFTKYNNIQTYGLPAYFDGNKWNGLIPGAHIKSLSQEHGILSFISDEINKIKVGDCIAVLPAHSCLTASELKHNYHFCSI